MRGFNSLAIRPNLPINPKRWTSADVGLFFVLKKQELTESERVRVTQHLGGHRAFRSLTDREKLAACRIRKHCKES